MRRLQQGTRQTALRAILVSGRTWRPLAALLTAASCICSSGCATHGTPAGKGASASHLVGDLALRESEAIAFHDRPVPPVILSDVLAAVRPYATVSKWRLTVVTERTARLSILTAMQEGFQRQGLDDFARTMERWKAAPVIFVFCLPQTLGSFGGVPPDKMRPVALIEMGMAVEALMLVGRTYGVETHWIAGAALVEQEIKQALGIPQDHDLALFGVAGYPSDQVTHDFPPLGEICYRQRWGQTWLDGAE